MSKTTTESVETLKNKIADFEKTITTLRTSVSELRDDVAQMKSSITTIATRQLNK